RSRTRRARPWPARPVTCSGPISPDPRSRVREDTDQSSSLAPTLRPGVVRCELPGTDPADVLRLDWRELQELRSEGVGQALIEGVAHHDLIAPSDGIEAVREVDGIADHAHVPTAQGQQREHLEVTQCYRDVHAGGRLDLVDLRLP